LPIVAVPWGYVFVNYIYKLKSTETPAAVLSSGRSAIRK
jgi:hypothetical protein